MGTSRPIFLEAGGLAEASTQGAGRDAARAAGRPLGRLRAGP